MADNKKTMNSSVFERLHNRFYECRKEIKRGKTLSDWDISDVMFTAGKALFAAISSKEIDLGDTPDWFVIEPEGTRIGDNDKGGCKDFVVYSWDLYWLSVIKWLAKNKPDSGITFSGDIHRVKPENYLHSGEDVVGLLMGLLRLRGEHLKRACSRLARASEDACLYLARKAIREPAETDRKVRSSFKKIIGWIVEVIIALALIVICLYFFGVVTGIFVFAALLAVFDYLGWLKPIKEFIYSILSPR